MTPPDRIYSKLGNFALRNYDFFGRSIERSNISFRKKSPTKETVIPSEEEVVNMVKKWRLDEPLIDHLEKEKQSDTLKKDNVDPEKVVEVIKEHRAESYTRLKDLATPMEIDQKLLEVKDIFIESGYQMEWNTTNSITIQEMMVEKNITGLEEFKNWMEKGNLGVVKRRIIKAAEGHAILNDEFSQRLEDINRYQDNKEVGDKRPILESPIVPDHESW